ncbi:probable galacturonosyltransferase 7 isoform X2 [Tanacetum coccineum]
MLMYKVRYRAVDVKYTRLVEDDNNETFKVQEQELAPADVSPLIKQFYTTHFVGASHGLVCLYGVVKKMLVFWNPSIQKSVGIAVPNLSFSWWEYLYGFGVCPDTSDPTVVRFMQRRNKPWHVEVFTLSSGVWNVIPSSNLLRQSGKLTFSPQVVIDRFIYWGAWENTFTDHGESTTNHMVVSFDLITKEFKLVDLPDSLTYKPHGRVPVFVSKLRESLVVYGSIDVEGAESCGVWVMQHDSSFKKLISIGARVDKILGFRESGEPIFETVKDFRPFNTLDIYDLFNTLDVNTLDVYDPCSQQINNLGICGVEGSFFMDSYKESLLLVDHSNLHIY